MIGCEDCSPIFIGNSGKSADSFLIGFAASFATGQRIFFVDIGVFFFLQPLFADHADQTFMQDVIARRGRIAVAANEAEGVQRHGLVPVIVNAVGNGQGIALINTEMTLEDKTGAIVP